MAKRGRPRSDLRLRAVRLAAEMLAEHHPMSLRQIFYRLVSLQVLKNTEKQYDALGVWLVAGRKEGEIVWEWMEDRLRRPRAVSMWQDVADFADTARRAYRRDVWATQDHLVECWLEKDALSGIFEDILDGYGMTLNVGRGYDGWSSIWNAAMRYLDWGGKVTILYFGDFDSSGLDMAKSLGKRIGFFGARPHIEMCALLRADIDDYDLPTDYAKPTDPRSAAFVAEYGDIATELDALPIEVLRERIRDSVESRMNLDALAETQEQEERDQASIEELLKGV